MHCNNVTGIVISNNVRLDINIMQKIEHERNENKFAEQKQIFLIKKKKKVVPEKKAENGNYSHFLSVLRVLIKIKLH